MSRSKRTTKKKPASARASHSPAPAEPAQTEEASGAPARGESFAFATAHQMASTPSGSATRESKGDPVVAAYSGGAGDAPTNEAVDPPKSGISETAADEATAAALYGEGEASPEPVVPHDHTHATAHDDHERGGFASTALGLLVGILVIAGLTLWLAPKLAPHMPAGVAEWLQPGAAAMDERIAELEGRLQDGQLSIEDRLAELEAGSDGIDEDGSLAAEIERLSGELQALTGAASGNPEVQAELETASNTLGALGSRADTIEADLTGIREELGAMAEALATGAGGSGDELSAAVAQVQSRAESIAQSVETLREDVSGRIGELDERLTGEVAALRASLDEATAGAAAAAEAQAAAEGAQRRSEAFAALSDAVASGDPFAAELAEAEEAAGSSAPDALAAAAEGGVPQTSVLSDELGPVARSAVAAEARAEGGDDAFSRVMTAVRANVLSRPVSETEGDDVGAVLSRVDARLAEGDATAALAEAETLPEETRAGLGPWYDRLKERAAAERALAEWRQSAGSDS